MAQNNPPRLYSNLNARDRGNTSAMGDGLSPVRPQGSQIPTTPPRTPAERIGPMPGLQSNLDRGRQQQTPFGLRPVSPVAQRPMVDYVPERDTWDGLARVRPQGQRVQSANPQPPAGQSAVARAQRGDPWFFPRTRTVADQWRNELVSPGVSAGEVFRGIPAMALAGMIDIGAGANNVLDYLRGQVGESLDIIKPPTDWMDSAGSRGSAVAAAASGGQSGGKKGSGSPANPNATALQNYIVGLDSGKIVSPEMPAMSSNPVNYFDMAGTNAEFAKANAIRQQTIDAQPRGAGIVYPQAESGGAAMYERALRLREQAGRTRDPGKAASLISQARQLTEMGQEANAPRDVDTSLQRALLELQAQQPLNDARAFQAEAEGIRALRGDQPERPAFQFSDLTPLLESGLLRVGEDGEGFGGIDVTTDFGRLIANAMLQSYGQPSTGMANGGLVSAIKSYAGGGMVTPGPAMPQVGELQRYQEYARGSAAMGLPPVPFDQFLQMQAGAQGIADQAPSLQGPQPGAIGMAAGGQVPDVGGKMVVDTDPDAPTDSIPAMIDGTQPAALDSGEFVFPKDAVMFYGLDRLNKMIAKVKESANGGSEQRPGADAGGSPSAIAAALGGQGL